MIDNLFLSKRLDENQKIIGLAKEVYASQINLTIMINAKQEKALLNFSQKLSLKEDEWMGDELVLEVL